MIVNFYIEVASPERLKTLLEKEGFKFFDATQWDFYTGVRTEFTNIEDIQAAITGIQGTFPTAIKDVTK